MDNTTSVLAGVVALGLLAIPAASTTIQQNSNIPSAEPPDTDKDTTQRPTGVESVNRSPTSVVRRTAEVGLEFVSRSGPGAESSVIERPGERLRKEVSPGAKVWNLTTPSAELLVRREPSRVVETLDAASGSMRMVREDGTTSTTYKGDRQSLESTHDEIRQRMSELQSDIEVRRARTRYSFNLSVRENPVNGSEHVVLENTGDQAADLSGWRIEDAAETSYTFEELSLDPGESARIYTEPEDEVDYSDRAVFDTGIAWNDGGDTASLYTESGGELTSVSY
nr:MAG: intermediate filament tail domain protein [Candidatus Nanosalinarum sp. J07AB56]